jgi:hypothetical protein
MPENRRSTRSRRNADFPVGDAPVGRPALRTADIPVGAFARSVSRSLARLLARLRNPWLAWIGVAADRNIHFQKYRVAPRLGTDTVRRRLLLRLHQQAPLAATETGLA